MLHLLNRMPGHLGCRVLFFSTIASSVAIAQGILPTEKGEKLFAAGNRSSLECRANPLQPALDFGFRFVSGYSVQVPFQQYSGSGHVWTMVTRVQPELGGQPVYFMDRLSLPNSANPTARGEVRGGFLLGEGRYMVSVQLTDNEARVCRAEWSVEAKPVASVFKRKLALEPGTIREISLNSLRLRKSWEDATAGKLTVLLHAAPFSPRSTKIPPGDASVLLAALSSLVQLAPTRSVRLVVFSLDQQKELYRRENFTLNQLGRVRQALFNLQLGTVDYRQLSQSGSVELLQHLVAEELHAADRAAAVVFLGPHSRASGKPLLEETVAQGHAPNFFYVEYQAPRRIRLPGPSQEEFLVAGDVSAQQTQDAASRTVGEPSVSGRFVIPNATQHSPFYPTSQLLATRDSIHSLVLKLKGKRFAVGTPVEFARAMDRISTAKSK